MFDCFPGRPNTKYLNRRVVVSHDLRYCRFSLETDRRNEAIPFLPRSDVELCFESLRNGNKNPVRFLYISSFIAV